MLPEDDKEIVALSQVAAAVSELPREAVERVLAYARARYMAPAPDALRSYTQMNANGASRG